MSTTLPRPDPGVFPPIAEAGVFAPNSEAAGVLPSVFTGVPATVSVVVPLLRAFCRVWWALIRMA